MYREVPSRIENAAAMEAAILEFWRERDIFHRSLSQTSDGPDWVFYEGPPTANGSPGTHHVEARVFKDVFPRHRTMKGYHVPRKAGWDCHGLPVELAVERDLGFSGKQDIEAYGVAEFNERCRESVLRHVGAFAEMTQRMGYWVDMDEAYWTMDPRYVESVWWSLQQIFDKGLLVRDHRVSPYCPRCGTGLSDHELAQGYEDVVDPSVFVRFPLTGGPLADRFPGVSLLVWTTTPWTLVSNTAVAAQPAATYAVVRTPDSELLVVAEALVAAAVGPDSEVLATMPGSELAGAPYDPPFELVEIPDAHRVITGEYVTTDDGSGLVHIAPAFGADDLVVARQNDLPVVNPIGADGRFHDDVPLVGGQFFKKADEDLVADLQTRGLLFKHLPYEHSYPHCWRCHTPLIYYAQPSWYIRTTARKAELLEQNEATNWFPATTKWGRYGDWLNNNIDWALSRNRYWGTPLPIWRCPEEHLTVVGSLAELSGLAGADLSALDPHRPFVDDVTLPCPTCGQMATRVPEVIDCWYDSGAMPFAQWGYPHRNVAEFEATYPADFICEAIDQTRGWFYTLMAVGTLVFDESSYRNVLCLGHILDEEGRKMSKHLGNVLEPIALMDEHGADSVRWFMLASGSPWQARRVGHQAVADVWRKTLSTYWSTVAFQALYARTSAWSPADGPVEPSSHVMDRWARTRAHQTVLKVDAALEVFDTQSAGRELARFIDDLSNWYVRRSRRRFWDGDPGALQTLHDCLRLLTLAMAPFTPFIAERAWQDLFRDTDGIESVHLAPWPQVDIAQDADLDEQMALVRRLVDLGRTARGESSVATRQPLSKGLIAAPGWIGLDQDMRQLVAEELNCLNLESLASAAGDLVDVTVKPNYRALGKRLGRQTPLVASAIAQLSPEGLVAQVRSDDGTTRIHVEGMDGVVISQEDLVITETPREGWAVATQDGETVALDLQLTPELVRAGAARQFIRVIQDARKSSGFDVSDRIVVRWDSDDPDLTAALVEHQAFITGEVLATDLVQGTDDEATGFGPKEGSFRVWVHRVGT
jgi:isoleucyl-tRNA synthetase